jgi:hypothetical protein
MRLYHQPAHPPVWLYVGYYRSQRQGETIHSPKHCYPGSGWHTLSSDVVTLDIPLSTHSTVHVNRYLIAKGLEKSLVFYWYHERGRVVASEYQAKIVPDARCDDSPPHGWGAGTGILDSLRFYLSHGTGTRRVYSTGVSSANGVRA